VGVWGHETDTNHTTPVVGPLVLVGYYWQTSTRASLEVRPVFSFPSDFYDFYFVLLPVELSFTVSSATDSVIDTYREHFLTVEGRSNKPSSFLSTRHLLGRVGRTHLRRQVCRRL
jgi:hypothetical protein